jgi:spore germination cell wall hydrolase CwlJ-like protein
MGRRSFRRVWHVIAALVPLPLIGLGYVGAVPGNRVAFEIQLFLAGNGSVHALPAARDASAEAHQPLPREAAQLFMTTGKGPRADRYLIVKTTTYAGKQFTSASVVDMPDVTGALGGGVIRARKGDRLNPPVTEVALRGAADDGLSTALFMTVPQFDRAFDFGGTPPSQGTIAYHPSGEGLAFKSKGESQAEFEERERRCLATAIYFEARGEPVRGQIAVGQVILNRVRSPQFPETICGVVYQGQMQKGCQFSFACDGHTDMPRNDDQWALAQDLSRQITSGQVWLPEVGYSTYYHADYVRPGWVSAMSKIDEIGRHIFYKKRNEQPYVVQEASAAPSTATPALALASSAPSDAAIAATPALSLNPSPSE